LPLSSRLGIFKSAKLKAVKSKIILILIFSLLIALILAGIGIGVFLKQEKDQIAKEIQEQKQMEQQREIEAQRQLDEQKKAEAQKEQQLEAEKEQADAKKIQTINDDLDKIDVRLQKVINEPKDFASKKTDEDRQSEEQRLKQLANSVKSEIDDIVIELKSAGFTNDDVLKDKLNDFFSNYDQCIFNERLSADYLAMGAIHSPGQQGADSNSSKYLQSLFDTENFIQKLKQKEK
jgi:ElaB/YqjD/DUF883 family membrane-anchored ribosome-binding protein